MPLSEFYQSANEKNESPKAQRKATAVSYIPNDEFVELVWEKGQIMMQGQSSNTRKTPVSSNFQFHTSKVEGRKGLFGQDDDEMVPWLNYPLEDYCSDLLPEISAVTVNEPRIGFGLDQSKPSNLSTIAGQGQGQGQALSGQMVQKQEPILPCTSSRVLNFSHFSRPAAMARASSVNQKEVGLVSQPSSAKPLDESHCVKKSVVVHKEEQDTQKSVEPIGASSSVCSGNSGERASNDLKGKSRDTEDFECQSEDVEEESLGVKTVATSRRGVGSKRSRAAEVHNLSERRRRDRINEKMRALQELIPNCNKVDKASMLDEAIEYLKTLQLQVQIMSMGSGFCMPPHMGMGYGPYGMPMPPTQGPRYPFPSPTPNIFQGQAMPMFFPQPPMARHMGPFVEFQNPSPITKDAMQNRNPHIMTQFPVRHETLDQSTSVGENDQVPAVKCVSPNSRPTGC